MNKIRDEIVETACHLMEMQGYHATGLNQIVKESGAPKGSLYYYFPDGKEEIAAEAIQRSGRQLAERVRTGLAQGESAGEAVRRLAETIAYHIEKTGFRAGGPLQAVAVETAISSERINQACREAYAGLRSAFAEKLRRESFSVGSADNLANLITAAIEGGIILSRTDHSGDPLRQVGRDLELMLACAAEREEGS